MERVLAVDMMNGTPTLAAALAVASSASLCKIPCTPTGATSMGEGNWTPKRVVWEEQSALLLPMVNESGLTSRLRWVASRSMRGIMRHCCRASRLLRYVLPVPALPNVYIYAADHSFPSTGVVRCIEVRRRTMIILHRFTRPLFDAAMVIRSKNGASTRQIDQGGVLGPCCLWCGGVVRHGENGANWGARKTA